GFTVFYFKNLRRRWVDLFFYSKSYAEDRSNCFFIQKVTQKTGQTVFYFKNLRRRRVDLFFYSKSYAEDGSNCFLFQKLTQCLIIKRKSCYRSIMIRLKFSIL